MDVWTLASLSDACSLTHMTGTPRDSRAACCFDIRPSQAAMTRCVSNLCSSFLYASVNVYRTAEMGGHSVVQAEYGNGATAYVGFKLG